MLFLKNCLKTTGLFSLGGKECAQHGKQLAYGDEALAGRSKSMVDKVDDIRHALPVQQVGQGHVVSLVGKLQRRHRHIVNTEEGGLQCHGYLLVDAFALQRGTDELVELEKAGMEALSEV